MEHYKALRDEKRFECLPEVNPAHNRLECIFIVSGPSLSENLGLEFVKSLDVNWRDRKSVV